VAALLQLNVTTLGSHNPDLDCSMNLTVGSVVSAPRTPCPPPRLSLPLTLPLPGGTDGSSSAVARRRRTVPVSLLITAWFLALAASPWGLGAGPCVPWGGVQVCMLKRDLRSIRHARSLLITAWFLALAWWCWLSVAGVCSCAWSGLRTSATRDKLCLEYLIPGPNTTCDAIIGERAPAHGAPAALQLGPGTQTATTSRPRWGATPPLHACLPAGVPLGSAWRCALRGHACLPALLACDTRCDCWGCSALRPFFFFFLPAVRGSAVAAVEQLDCPTLGTSAVRAGTTCQSLADQFFRAASMLFEAADQNSECCDETFVIGDEFCLPGAAGRLSSPGGSGAVLHPPLGCARFSRCDGCDCYDRLPRLSRRSRIRASVPPC